METKNKYKGRIGKQTKSFSFETKDLSINSGSRKISGYAAIFGNIDKAGDMLIKGCFSKSIQDRGPESAANDKIIFLWMHDMSEPIGRLTALREDERGLYFEAVIGDVERGNQALTQLESGTLNQFSTGYRYVWEKCEWDEERDCLIVKEVVLYEISAVSIGMNGETEYLGLKSEEDYQDRYCELVSDIDVLCKGLNVIKQQELQRIIAKAMSLASARPESNPPAKEADVRGKKSMFNKLKLKQDCL